MVKRILGRAEGRNDDNLEVLTKRLQTFKESTQPIAKRFAELNKLVEIDADGSPDAIFDQIKIALHLTN